MPEMKQRLPLWAQMLGGLWLLGIVVIFLRQIIAAYMAMLGHH